MSVTKGAPLSKEEVSLLIDLIEKNKIVTSKATNATNNQLKETAWSKITTDFNASITSYPRRVEQLKLKWENLKKTARKRAALIRLNRNKTGGGKPDYIPPDDALDRVASILGATCEGYPVQYGGDAEPVRDAEPIKEPETTREPEATNEPESIDNLIIIEEGANLHADSEANDSVLVVQDNTPPPPPQAQTRNIFFTKPKQSGAVKRKKLQEEDLKVRIV